MNIDEREKLAEVIVKIERLKEEIEYIKAKHIKDIWTSDEFSIEKHGYNFVQRLREAELVVRLNEDQDYKVKSDVLRRLRADKIELGGEDVDLWI